MSLTRREAITEINTLFKDAWELTENISRVKWDNVGSKSVPPDGQEPWARVVLRHNTSRQATLAGAVGTRRFERKGTLVVQVFEIPGKGLSGAVDLPIVVSRAYEGVASPGGVWFRDVTINEVGQDGDFFQTNVVVSFEYDEIK